MIAAATQLNGIRNRTHQTNSSHCSDLIGAVVSLDRFRVRTRAAHGAADDLPCLGLFHAGHTR